MEALIKAWGGEEILIRHDQPTGAWFVIAIHSTRLGPATGGTRMKHYPDLDAAISDAMRLARGMTYKFAVTEWSRGGGKAVIALPEPFDATLRVDMLRRYGRLIYQLGGLYETGPDVGTSPADMDVIAETGAPYVFCRTPERGGAGDSSPPTAAGVHSGIRVVCDRLFGTRSLEGRRILVQGAGSVGSRLTNLLLADGAQVLLAEVDSTRAAPLVNLPGVTPIDAAKALETTCDVFAPCALGGVLSPSTIEGLKCRAVAGAANNQLGESDDASRLRDRGILYAPDYIINIGGALAIPGIEKLGWSAAEAERRVRETVESTLVRVFDFAEAEGVTTEEAARRIATTRLDQEGGSRPQEDGNEIAT